MLTPIDYFFSEILFKTIFFEDIANELIIDESHTLKVTMAAPLFRRGALVVVFGALFLPVARIDM